MLTPEEKSNILSCDPFEGDFGDQSDRVFLDRIGIARKPGLCSFCDGSIKPGDEQRRMSAKFDGEMRSYRWCVSCCLDLVHIDDDDYDDEPSTQQSQGEGK